MSPSGRPLRERDWNPDAPDGHQRLRINPGILTGIEHALAHWYACPHALRLGAGETPDWVSRAAREVDDAAKWLADVFPAARARLPHHAVNPPPGAPGQRSRMRRNRRGKGTKHG